MADRYTHAEQIGKLADRIDNLLGAMQLPLPAHMHLEGLRVALPEIRNTLRLIYTAETGEDPWSTHPHGVGAAPASQEVSPALERQRRLVATLPQTREDAEALMAGHREPWRIDLPDGAYLQLPGDPPGPSALRRVQAGIVYDVQPSTGRLLLASKPRMLPGCMTEAVRADGVPVASQRERFESWHRRTYATASYRRDDESYADPVLETRWQSWLACAADGVMEDGRG